MQESKNPITDHSRVTYILWHRLPANLQSTDGVCSVWTYTPADRILWFSAIPAALTTRTHLSADIIRTLPSSEELLFTALTEPPTKAEFGDVRCAEPDSELNSAWLLTERSSSS
jgi:hypothetical protein